MPAHQKPIVPSMPVVDEWGFYDPDRAGLAAVFAKLEARRGVSRGEPYSLARLLREQTDVRSPK